MREVADDVWLLTGLRGPVNAYLVGTVLVDAGGPWDAGYLLRILGDLDVQGHALTHAHPDHTGSSHAVCEKLGIPFWVGRDDVPGAEDPGLMAKDFARMPFLGTLPRNPLGNALLRVTSGPGHPVDHALVEGDAIDDFTVLEVPGHTRGHIALWREADGVLIGGDVVFNYPRLMAPPRPLNADNGAVKASIAKIAALEPTVALFGHGPPLRDHTLLTQLTA